MTWPFAGVAAPTDWQFINGSGEPFYWKNGSIAFDGAGPSDLALLTADAVAAFDESVPAGTPCLVQWFVTAFGDEGGFEFRMREGDWAFVPVLSNGIVAVFAKSGEGSGFEMRGTAGGAGVASLSGVAIEPAKAARLVAA